jgi:hypothetical protein
MTRLADTARTSFVLMLNPGKVGSPWLADPGLLIGITGLAPS